MRGLDARSRMGRPLGGLTRLRRRGCARGGPWSGPLVPLGERGVDRGLAPANERAGRDEASPGSGVRRCRRRGLPGVAGECAAPCGVAPGHVGALASAVGASARGVRLVEQARPKASSTSEADAAGSGISPRPQASVLLRLERNAAPSPWPTARVGLQNAASTLISLAAALVRRALSDRDSSAAGRVSACASPSMGIVGMLESMAAARRRPGVALGPGSE